jgi:mannosylglycerate hydrolase
MQQMTCVYLVPHTHWDREWYRPFQSFRMQLVELIDTVLDMLESDEHFAFTLDGQLSTIDDYLEVRPGAEERIRRHVESGRLAVGPWLILMDEFLVSGESLVRNLELGMRRGEEMGGAMQIGYLPDMFGHIAQMPQILRRAGLDDAVVWRGVPAAVDAHAFRWVAPDGSAVRAQYLHDGYGNAAYIFAVPHRMHEALERFVDHSRHWYGSDPMLGMYGTDHTAPIPRLGTLVRDADELLHETGIQIATLAKYVDEVADGLPARPVWHGEMRAAARSNVLMGVTSARIDIKAACGRAERLLERYAEPLTSLWVPADAWPAAFLGLAWRRVIENSAHDSICGCSVDEVADQVHVRYAEAQQIAASLARRALSGVAARVPRQAAVVMNPSPFEREDLIEIELPIPEEWSELSLELPDGRRVATQELEHSEPLLYTAELRGSEMDELFNKFHGREVFDRSWNGFEIDRVDGRPRITFDVDDDPHPAFLDVTAMRSEIEEAMQATDEHWIVRILARPRRRMLACLPAPALGWTAARPLAGSAELDDPVGVDDDGRGMRNAELAIRVAEDGTLELSAADGTRLSGAGRLVDGGDFGDSYNYAPPAKDTLVDCPEEVGVRVLESGPLRCRIAIDRSYRWPVGLQPDGSRRSGDMQPVTVTTEISLRTGEPFMRLRVAFENRVMDHRLRLHLPLARPAGASFAEGQFAVVSRGLDAEGGYREHALPTWPARGWVAAGGVAVLLDHILEYELLSEPGASAARELALTIHRGIGLISSNDNPYRSDPAGPEIAVPGAQGLGPRHVGFAVYPHAGTWSDADIVRGADRYQHPFLAGPGAAPDAGWPPSGAETPGLAIDGHHVALSALRRREDGWIELRVACLSDEPHPAVVRGRLTEARASDLLGRPGEPLPLTDGALELALQPWEIRTVQVRRDEPEAPPANVLYSAGPRRNR